MNLDLFKDIMINNQPVIKLQVGDIIIWQKQSGDWQLDEDGYIIGSDGKYYQRYYIIVKEIDNNPIPDLNDQWVTDTVSGSLNIDKNFDYYMSNSNWHVGNGYAQFKVSWSNLDSIEFLYRSYAESNYDYLVINGLDKPKFESKPSSSTAGILAHTNGSQTTTYKKLTVNCDKNEHFIWFCYLKDGSVDSNSDRAFVGIPNNLKEIEEIEKQGAELRYEFVKGNDFIMPREGYVQFKYYKTYFSPNNMHSWTTDEYELGPEVPVTPITRNYLRFDATEGDLTVGFVNPSWFTELEYSLGYDETWAPFDTDVLVKNNTSIYFRAKGGIYNSTEKYFTTSTQCECHGNIMSLLGDNFENITYIPASGNYCFAYLFRNCHIKTAPELPATTLRDNCYQNMFQDCTSLVNAPALPATTIAIYCYNRMFSGCTSLVNAPALPATNIQYYSRCYNYMFQGCTSLVTAPELPATTLGEGCYGYMFQGCTSLVNVPELPATTLKDYCYESMFQDCTSLVNVPALRANTLGRYCCQHMFQGCTSLVTAPELPATTLANYCYSSMFAACNSLVNAPELPATTLANYCYSNMFSNCTSLVTAPELPATTLTTRCYYWMFFGCISLKEIYCMARYASEATEITTEIGNNWLSSVPNTSTCIFHKNPEWAGPTARGNNTIPSNWQIVDWIQDAA